jgi:hypothetical protein
VGLFAERPQDRIRSKNWVIVRLDGMFELELHGDPGHRRKRKQSLQLGVFHAVREGRLDDLLRRGDGSRQHHAGRTEFRAARRRTDDAAVFDEQPIDVRIEPQFPAAFGDRVHDRLAHDVGHAALKHSQPAGVEALH